MKLKLGKAITHREFLKTCGLAALGAGAAQLVVAPKPVLAQQYNEDLFILGTHRLAIGKDSSALAKLDIVTDSGFELYFSGSDTPNVYALQSMWINTAAGKTITIGANGSGSQHITIKSDGTVGIGNANPTVALDVTGSIRATSNVNVLGALDVTGGGRVGGALGVGTATPAWGAAIANSGSEWELRFIGGYTTNIGSDGDVYINTIGGSAGPITLGVGSSGANHIRIATTGKVGIGGVSDPQYALHVAGSIYATGTVEATARSAYYSQ